RRGLALHRNGTDAQRAAAGMERVDRHDARTLRRSDHLCGELRCVRGDALLASARCRRRRRLLSAVAKSASDRCRTAHGRRGGRRPHAACRALRREAGDPHRARISEHRRAMDGTVARAPRSSGRAARSRASLRCDPRRPAGVAKRPRLYDLEIRERSKSLRSNWLPAERKTGRIGHRLSFGAQALLAITEGGHMHQATTMNERVERGIRLLAVVSLACTLTAFGCTTSRTAGNGQPTSSGPALGPASPTTTPGSSSGTAVNPPMASSAIPIDPTRPSSVDALAVLAADQAYQGRVLGTVNPDGAQSAGPIPTTGQFVNPALVVNPQITVNSSVSSAQVGPGITGAPVSGGGASAIGPATAAMIATTSATSAATTAAAANAAIPSMSNAAIAAGT